MGTHKLFRWFELSVVFVVLPLVYVADWLPIPVIPILLLVTVSAAVALWRDPEFGSMRLWRIDRLVQIAPRMLLFFTTGGTLIAAGMFLLVPEWMFSMVLNKPYWWAGLMVLYPVLSAFPQEFLFRTFFFHRYRHLASEQTLVWLSSGLFGFMHIVYENWTCVLLSTIGGYLFTRTYLQTRSLLCVTLEHALYGCFIFTIGLGRLFYVT